MSVKQVTIGKQVSLTFLALLEVSVGAVREISRIALWQCQCLFTMQWIYVMYSTKKIYVMFSLKCMSRGRKNTTGIIVPFNFVPFNFVLKSSMSWQCFEIKRTDMYVSEFLNAKCLVEVTHPWRLWTFCGRCFICWRECPCEWSMRPRHPPLCTFAFCSISIATMFAHLCLQLRSSTASWCRAYFVSQRADALHWIVRWSWYWAWSCALLRFFSISIATMFAHLCLQLRSPSGKSVCV